MFINVQDIKNIFVSKRNGQKYRIEEYREVTANGEHLVGVRNILDGSFYGYVVTRYFYNHFKVYENN